jgi:hypothetical protein
LKEICTFAAVIKKQEAMEATVLNPTQLHLLNMFSYDKDEDSLKEMKKVLFKYYCEKMDEESDKWWKENNMTSEKFDEMTKDLHFRTPYK